MSTNWPDLYKSDDPDYNNPRFQRRIIAIYRPIPVVENVYDVTLECGHAPLLLQGNNAKDPVVGGFCFCPTCRDQERKS